MVFAEVGFTHSGGVAGAELFDLFDPGDAFVVGEVVEDFFFSVSDDDADMLDAG
jgi:hypothetical protein